MILLFLLTLTALQAQPSKENDLFSFFKNIPECGQSLTRVKNKQVPKIEAKFGAILQNIVCKELYVAKILQANHLKTEKVILTGCIAYFEDSEIQHLIEKEMGVCCVKNVAGDQINFNGRFEGLKLKANSIKGAGQLFLKDSIVVILDISCDSIELINTSIQKIFIKALKVHTPKIILINSKVQKLVFLGKKGRVIKRDHQSKILDLANGCEEILF